MDRDDPTLRASIDISILNIKDVEILIKTRNLWKIYKEKILKINPEVKLKTINYFLEKLDKRIEKVVKWNQVKQ